MNRIVQTLAVIAVLVAGAFAANHLIGPRNTPASVTTGSTNLSNPSAKTTTVRLKPANDRLLEGLPGMPAYDPSDVYAFTEKGMFKDTVKNIPERVYVPDSKSNTVSVIDPKTYTVIDTFKVGAEPQHVVPSYDLSRLYVVNDKGHTVTPVDPATGKPGTPLHVRDPYNLYFTPDGQSGIVVAEFEKRLDFVDPKTLQVRSSLRVPCRGVNHMDFSADGRYIIAACEFSGEVLKIDVTEQIILGTMRVGGMPQDVKMAPDGSVFFVADMMANGLHVLDGDAFTNLGFIPTGKGAHGLYPSRDARSLYISNRGEGTVSVLDFATRTITAKWVIPGGGSPDMGSVSPDGTELWLGGRYHGEVYVFDTVAGKLKARIKVGRGPHGLTYFPQPGRYSLGHTGVYR